MYFLRFLLKGTGILSLTIVMASKLSGQDIHFSQFYTSPQNLNPSMCGHFDGDLRLTLNNRSQWKQVTKPYKTLAVGLEKQFYIFNENISAGLLFVNDKSGVNLKVNKFLASLAYHKNIHTIGLHGAFQLGYVSKTVGFNDLTFPNQLNWDLGKYDANLPNFENNPSSKISSFDLNAGFAVNKKFRKIEPLLGFSFFHFNTPKESFKNGSNQLNARFACNAEIKCELNKKLTLIPKFLFMQHSKASEMMTGTNLNIKVNDGKGVIPMVFGGVYFRNNKVLKSDAFALVGGAKYRDYEIGLSYDFNVSPLHIASNYRGAFEISFIYISPSTRLKKTIVPCERF